MNVDRTTIVYLTLPLVAILCVGGLWWVDHSHALQSSDQRQHALIDEVASLLEAHYDGEVKRDTLVAGSLKGMAAAINDRYTIVWNPTESKAQNERTSGSYAGIGATIDQRPGELSAIHTLIPGGPAEKAGIKPGDRVKSVDGTEALGLSNEQLLAMVRGEPETQVTLGILRGKDDDETFLEIVVTRGIVPILSVQGIRMLDDDRTGYFRIDTFNQQTAIEFKKAVETLQEQGMQQLIVDLRHNGGGVLDTAVEIADFFIEEDGKPIVSIRAGEEKLARLEKIGFHSDDVGKGQIYASNDSGSLGDIPLVLLVNGESASASEVLAGALQDYDLAFIIGTPTYGKGVVQQTFNLPSDPRYILKVTVARYFTPLGHALEHSEEHSVGITPDVTFPITEEEFYEMHRRFEVQRYKVPESPDEIADEKNRKAWLTADPHIEAALKYFKGEKIVVPLGSD